MKVKRTRFWWMLILAFSLLACQATANLPFLRPTPTPTATSTPTLPPTPTRTPTPTPTPTPVPAARVDRGEKALRNGDWDQALQEFQTARDASQSQEIQAAAQLGIGRTYLAAGQYQPAANAFQAIIANTNQTSQVVLAYFHLGKAYQYLGQFVEAAAAYRQFQSLRPGVVDGYIYDLSGDALLAAGDYAGAALDYQSAIQAPSLLDEIQQKLKLAYALTLKGDSAAALQLYNDLLLQTHNEYTKALIDLRKGQIYLSQGETDQAYAVFQDAVNNYPKAYDSYSALVVLVEAGVEVNELNRGIVDYYAGQYPAAEKALERFIQAKAAVTDPGNDSEVLDSLAVAHFYLGLAHWARGTNVAATREWDIVIQRYPDQKILDRAWEEKAFTLWYYLDDYPAAVQALLDFVAKKPSHPRAAEFLFDAAQVAERDKKLQQAAELWERLSVEYPTDDQTPRALFLAGISRYRLADYTGALATFQRLNKLVKTLTDRSMALFWTAKAQSALGDSTAARATWELAAQVDPTGYYSERARDILRDVTPFSPPQSFDLVLDWKTERSKAESWLRLTFGLPENLDLNGLGELSDNPYLKRGTELWNLDLFEEARGEFEYLRQALQAEPAQTYRLMNYLYGLGLYRSATMAARQVLDLAGMNDASSFNAPAYFNHIRFGTYYSEIILPQAQQYNFHPLFIFSLIRQESLFESFVRSSAAASGLMQIIPATGEDIAKRLKWPDNYTQVDLYRPMVNVAFGVYYLDRQRQSFDGDIYAALAAYNGGPGNALAWQELAPNDIDLFLEVIRYSETRDYIRRIYEIFTIYRQIYDRTP